jgi:uncharacterized membrane protein YeaQ/YmgE (transglycosylase-associated protein family)
MPWTAGVSLVPRSRGGGWVEPPGLVTLVDVPNPLDWLKRSTTRSGRSKDFTVSRGWASGPSRIGRSKLRNRPNSGTEARQQTLRFKPEVIMSIIAWIILGLIAGFIANKIVDHPGGGLIFDTVLGIIGAVVGGWLFSFFGAREVTGFNLYSLIVAIVGAVVVLLIYHAFTGARPANRF